MKVRRTRTKPCTRCGEERSALYRVRLAERGDWLFLCASCGAAVKPDNPHYVYGGTWKRAKRH